MVMGIGQDCHSVTTLPRVGKELPQQLKRKEKEKVVEKKKNNPNLIEPLL